MKKPWFRWLSFLGFFGYWTVLCRGMAKKDPRYPDKSSIMGKVFVLWLLFMLAGLLLTALYYLISAKNPQLGDLALLGEWIILYFLGVFITDQLYIWMQKNMR